ncbi:MAG: SusC/RagA family TonB-linked outer membrane protein [Bacteroidetes bacterium]|nr:MAG: SusC/RagA family TonB-linked outer membrane protein [Bacteroidota bacterium]PTM13553.1 MAG: SusC/RagA family TonB-linked outer membrane protein [Bacteroidota bacterium]
MKICLTRASFTLVTLLMLAAPAMAQYMVKGSVKDAFGEPLIGVSILVKGTTTGTVSDFDGNFELNVPAAGENIAIFSYTGFKTEEVAVESNMGQLDVVMAEDIARLDEVVVTGLASGVKRSNSGNAVATISASELMGNTTPQTVDNALYGKLTGVNINANGGSPGGGVSVQMRGISTLGAGSSQPLYIIDGVYVNNSSIRNGRSQVSGATGGQSSATQDDAANRIADINPEDIERIEVLKGPSAAAIYGTRANAGVIIITTKKGVAGQSRVSFSQDIGFAQGQNFQNFDDWDVAKVNTYFGSQAQLDALAAAEAEGRVTNWEDYFYGEKPLLLNTQLNISGGSDKTQFYVSGGILSEDGIIKNTGFDRYSIRANVDHRLSDRIKISLNSSYLKSDNDRGFTGNQNNTGGSIGYALAYTPSYANLFPDAQGNYPDNPYFNDNPIAIRDLGVNNQQVDRFISAGSVDIDLYQSANSFLKFRLNGGIDYLSGNSLVYFPEVLQHQRASNNPGDLMRGRQDDLNTNIQAFLNYNTNLGKINSNTSVGAIRLDQRGEYTLNRGRGLSGGQDNLGWAQVVSTISQLSSTVTDIGYVVQEDLNWEDKIVISAGLRLDKSTLNYKQDDFYSFAKLSGAFNIHNFDFWKIDAVSQLKLRAAFGQTGGLPTFGTTFESLTPQLIGGQLGGQVGTRGVDPNLVPETAQEIELGIDLGLWRDNLVLEATYYIKGVNDLILDQVPAESTGILAIATNAADLENKGLELALSLHPVRRQNFDWFTRLMYWDNRSEITRLDIPAFTQGGFGPSLGTYLLAKGYSPTTIVGTPAGLTTPAGGFTVYGDRQPNFTMSWFNSFKIFKNLDLTLVTQYQDGGNAINLSALLWDDGGTSPNWDNDANGNEQPDGLDRLLAWAVDGNTSVYIEETSYLKLREAGLYYTFPRDLGFVNRLKLGVSANNVLLWTNYGGYDPEVSNFGTQAVTGNIDVTPYPSARRLFFHLKAEF